MKRLSSLILVLLFYSAGFAQASLGIKAGINYSKITSSLPANYSLGWQAGLYSKASLNEKLAFQPELDYSVKESKLRTNNVEWSIRLSQVNARILGIYNITEWLYAGGGPYFSYLIDTQQDKIYVNDNYFAPFAVGLIFGPAIETGLVTFMIRYDLGLTFLTLDADPEIKDNLIKGSKMQGIEFTAGFNF